VPELLPGTIAVVTMGLSVSTASTGRWWPPQFQACQPTGWAFVMRLFKRKQGQSLLREQTAPNGEAFAICVWEKWWTRQGLNL